MNTDSIEREVLIEAPIERVWAALTESASVRAWFCNVFSFHWAVLHPGVLATEENSTLVEFTRKSTPKGTVLRVLESGFETLALPVGRSLSSLFEDHSGGWPQVINELAKYVMANAETPRVDSP